MVRKKKVGGATKGKKRSNPQPPIESFGPRIFTPEVAAAKKAKLYWPLNTGQNLKSNARKQYNPAWDLGQGGNIGEHALIVLPGGRGALSKAIDKRSAELEKLNREGTGIFKQGSVNLQEDTGLRSLDEQRVILETLIEELLQAKKRAVEIPPELIGTLQVHVEKIPSCAADLIKLHNTEIVQLPPQEANSQVGIGSRVTVEYLNNAERRTFLVGSYYTNEASGKDELSYITPLAQAAMGAAKGSVCEQEIGSGKRSKLREFRILEIE